MVTSISRRKGGDLIASLLSWVFHPVFQPVMLIGFLLFSNTSSLFLAFHRSQLWMILGQAFTLYTFFPLVTVGLLKAVGFLESVHLRTQKDRVIPLVAVGIWYFWIWYVWKNLPDYPIELVQFALAAWTTSWVSLLINARMKISLHTLSAGLILAFLFLWAMKHQYGAGFYLPIACLWAGVVGAARLHISDHTRSEVYLGYAVGVASMCIIWILY
ncbi:MAG: hypothetical protein ACKO6Q_04565 [Bacteroidota bacterium]